ncbi:MAG TPA: SufD family Fe-S cluster assembly protein, partial [Candidatus Poseidoniales archaeon]|nr:SufD family Fe-S cluster assembly protein [Candidatus Poseidoniales archaeon]
NLLLSDKARADSIPELEVLADEVKAAHGAASAPVNPQQVHYLMSRGLSPQQAEALIVEGFLIDAFSCLTDIDLKGVLATRMTIHLECELKR